MFLYALCSRESLRFRNPYIFFGRCKISVVQVETFVSLRVLQTLCCAPPFVNYIMQLPCNRWYSVLYYFAFIFLVSFVDGQIILVMN